MFELVNGRLGLPTVRVAETDGIYLHSLYDPVTEAHRLVDTWDVPHDTHRLTIVGLGLGYHVAECLRRFPNVEEVQVIECSDELVALAKSCFPETLADTRVRIVTPVECSEVGRLVSAEDIQSVFFHPPSLTILAHEPTRVVLAEILMLQASTRVLLPRLQSNWSHHKRLVSRSTALTGEQGGHRGRAGVLVSAGPSLDGARSSLASYQQSGAVLVVVSAALKRVLGWGIVPDYAVHTDSSDKACAHIEGLTQFSRVPQLLALPTVHPSFVDYYPGPVRWALQQGLDDVNEFATLHHYDTFPTGGSVATLGLSLLHYFGCDPIVFIGQDLAYVQGQAYASGIHREISPGSRSELCVPSVYGGLTETTLSWNSFRHWIEHFILTHPDRLYINRSYGAKIAGTRSEPSGEFT